MKILIFTGIEFTFEKFVYPLALELKNKGHLIYTSFNKKEYIGQKYDDNGFRFFYNSIERNTSLISFFKSTTQLIKVCKKNRIDVIHCHTPIASIVARIAGIFLVNTKIIYTCHGFYFHENMNRIKFLIFFTIEFLLSKITTKILFVSMEDYNFALKYKLKNKSNLKFISNGVSTFFNPINNKKEKNLGRSKYKIPNNNFTFGVAARFVKEKGFIELIHAFSQILKEFPNTSLCICGSRLKGEHNDDVSYFIKKACESFPKNIFLIGELSSNKMPSFYKILDTFILPSWREGMPMTILEAMMSGLPIIATDIRGCREAVKHNQNGILFKYKNVKDLKNALLIMLKNKKLKNNFAKKSREIALKEFTQKRNLERQLEVFEKLEKKL